MITGWAARVFIGSHRSSNLVSDRRSVAKVGAGAAGASIGLAIH